MIGVERAILVPLGDTSNSDVEGVAFSEARDLSYRILGEEDARERKVATTIVSLQKHPRVNPFYYLKQLGVTAIGGFLVKSEPVLSKGV